MSGGDNRSGGTAAAVSGTPMEETMRFILRWEAGLTEREARGGDVASVFAMACGRGYSDDPADRGGATQCGVTLATYRGYCSRKGLPVPGKRELRDIPFDRWREIFNESYWDRWRADSIADARVARILVDWVWASGTHGIRGPQRLLGVKADGAVGPVTLAAVNAAAPDILARRLIEARLEFVEGIVRRSPSQRRFLKGWRRRICDL